MKLRVGRARGQSEILDRSQAISKFDFKVQHGGCGIELKRSTTPGLSDEVDDRIVSLHSLTGLFRDVISRSGEASTRLKF